MVTGPLIALSLQGVLAAAAALLARRAKVAASFLGAACFLAAPWLAGSVPLLRGLSALLGGWVLLRVIDAVRVREPWSAARRVLHVVSLVDSRVLRRAPMSVDLLALGRALLWAALAAGAFHVARSPHLALRWGGGLVLAYAIIEAGYLLISAAHRAVGIAAPILHDLPLASLSVGELWSLRWATPVSAWLRQNCFRPLARRGHARAGLFLGFVASGFGHAYPIVVALDDVAMAAMMFAFFLVQGLFVILEARVGTARWPRPARRAWTITLMVASSPLFVEPALRVLGVR